MATRRVLVVDDEAEVRKALAGILRAMRYPDALEIEEVADGQAGLDAVIRQRPDLILLDLHMPRMSGLTLLEHIRDVQTRVPIIVVSATEDSKVAAEALRPGAVAYLPKPFDPRHVETLVATFFDSAKRRESKPNASRCIRAGPRTFCARKVTNPCRRRADVRPVGRPTARSRRARQFPRIPGDRGSAAGWPGACSVSAVVWQTNGCSWWTTRRRCASWSRRYSAQMATRWRRPATAPTRCGFWTDIPAST